MSEPSMNQEQGINIDANQTAEEGLNAPLHEIPITELHDNAPVIRFPHILRRANIDALRQEEDQQSFLAFVDFSERLRAVSEVFPQTAITSNNPGEYYNAQKLQDKFSNAPDEGRRNRIRTGLAEQIDGAKRTVLNVLKEDLRLLFRDQGLTEDEIKTKISDITTGTVGNKKRDLFQLPLKGQIGVIENMAELRIDLLAGNFDSYLYYLSHTGDGEVTEGESTIQKRARSRYSEAKDKKAQAAVSADTRNDAAVGMNEAFYAQVGVNTGDNGKLGTLELMAGKRMPTIKKDLVALRERYTHSSLPQKAAILGEIQEKKLQLAAPYVNNVIALRRSLEKDLGVDKHITGDLSPEQRLQEEMRRIMTLLTLEQVWQGHYQEQEVHIEDTIEDVKSLAKRENNPVLIDAYNLVLLLRESPSEMITL